MVAVPFFYYATVQTIQRQNNIILRNEQQQLLLFVMKTDCFLPTYNVQRPFIKVLKGTRKNLNQTQPSNMCLNIRFTRNFNRNSGKGTKYCQRGLE